MNDIYMIMCISCETIVLIRECTRSYGFYLSTIY